MVNFSQKDHPRGCGENRRKMQRCGTCAGSPPRMRGKLQQTGNEGWLCRITPADAGKTFRERLRSSLTRDHPRGCGENSSSQMLMVQFAGSPPRMRGKQTQSTARRPTPRITPADAGKTACAPHGRESIRGSPPRMRGKPGHGRLSFALYRITPADAGKTSQLVFCVAGLGDHPRGCGENNKRRLAMSLVLGSPPRMRGKPPPQCGRWERFRITPADAGKTV